jgi:hypothetical protein
MARKSKTAPAAASPDALPARSGPAYWLFKTDAFSMG